MNTTPQPATDTPARSWTWIGIWAGLSALAVIAVVVMIARTHHKGPPSPDGDPVEVAKYVSTADFLNLDFDQQRAYLFNLRKSAATLRDARASGRLNEAQYRDAKAGAWIGGKLEHLRDYLKQPNDQAKLKYIDDMLARQKAKKASSAPDDEPTVSNSPEVKRIVRSWSKRREADWEHFHKVSHERKAVMPPAPTSRPHP
jgi:hypothetical protein